MKNSFWNTIKVDICSLDGHHSKTSIQEPGKLSTRMVIIQRSGIFWIFKVEQNWTPILGFYNAESWMVFEVYCDLRVR